MVLKNIKGAQENFGKKAVKNYHFKPYYSSNLDFIKCIIIFLFVKCGEDGVKGGIEEEEERVRGCFRGASCTGRMG